MNFRTVIMAAVASVALASAANAVPVTGQISLGGYAQGTGGTGMGSATGISFATYGTTSTGMPGYVISGNSGGLSSFGSGTGAFAALGACSTLSSCGTIKNIGLFATQAPLAQFLTLTTGTNTSVSFDLTSIGAITRTSDGTGGSLVFTANGTINYTGYDPTAGVFTLTTQGNQITSFSATTLAAATVPEPMSLALLGGSLAAVGLIRRKKA